MSELFILSWTMRIFAVVEFIRSVNPWLDAWDTEYAAVGSCLDCVLGMLLLVVSYYI